MRTARLVFQGNMLPRELAGLIIKRPPGSDQLPLIAEIPADNILAL